MLDPASRHAVAALAPIGGSLIRASGTGLISGVFDQGGTAEASRPPRSLLIGPKGRRGAAAGARKCQYFSDIPTDDEQATWWMNIFGLASGGEQGRSPLRAVARQPGR